MAGFLCSWNIVMLEVFPLFKLKRNKVYSRFNSAPSSLRKSSVGCPICIKITFFIEILNPKIFFKRELKTTPGEFRKINSSF